MPAYQREGAAFLAARTGALLADDPGLGKTRQALEAARVTRDRILVVCPAIARYVWPVEAAKWRPELLVDVLDGPAGPLPPADLLVVSYDKLVADEALRARLRRERFGALIADEAHYAKNGAAKRTRAIYGPAGLRHSAERVWLLTGTPAPNHHGELWTHLRATHPDFATTAEHDFQDQFCTVENHPNYGRRVVGSANQGDLVRRLRGWMLRRRKGDVLAELPDLRVSVEPLPVTAAIAAEMRRIEREHGALPNVRKALEADDLGALIRATGQDFEHVATLRRMVGLLKVAGAVAWAENLLDEQPKAKLILFAVHREVLAKLQAGLAHRGAVLVDGSTSAKDRAGAVEAFQGDPRTRVFVGQIAAAGTAITLTAAADVGIVEPSWTPADNIQAIARAHRMGQRRAVWGRYLTLHGSLDERIVRVLARKSAELAPLMETEAA